MEVFEKIPEIQSFLREHSSIGLVPTMGALHEGHISLIRRAIAQNDTVVCSIFINPTQFNNPADLKNYPRSLDADLKLLEEAGCDSVFVPSEKEMYPNGTPFKESIDLGYLDETMEGLYRTNHFQGVANVVSKLFDIVQPHCAFFGEKDYQQLLVIKRLVKMQTRNIVVVPCPINREKSGLAMSSRNALLSIDARNQASFLYETLSNVKGMVPTTSISKIYSWVEDQFAHSALELEYFEIADKNTLRQVQNWSDSQHVRGFIAAHLEGVRLIDNLSLIP